MNNKTKRIVTCAVQLISVALLVTVDYLIKELAVDKLYGKPPYVLIKGFLGFIYAENTGAAFSLFSSSTTLLSVITGAALTAGIVALFCVKKKPLIYDICVPLIIAGGFGNLFDRITRGFVVDYIQTLFIDFPIFNFADCLITCSAIAVIIYLIIEIISDSKKKKTEAFPTQVNHDNVGGDGND